MRSLINEALHQADQYSPDDIDLEHFLGRIHERTLTEARDAGLSAHPALVAFGRNMTVKCSHCASNSTGVVCSGGILDADTLAFGGRCWKLIGDLFERLCEWAAEYYAHIPSMADATLVLTLMTRVAAGKEVTGSTAFPPEDLLGNRMATIAVDLPDDLFDECHIGALPYVIFHEVFVHAAEAWAATGPRIPSDELNILREGFLDRAAFLLLEERLKNPGTLPEPFAHAVEAILAAADVAHIRRLDMSDVVGVSGRSADHRRSCVGARQRGHERFNRWVRTHGLSRAVQIATYLNTLVLSLDQQSAFLDLIELAGVGADWDHPVADRDRLFEPLRGIEAAVMRGDSNTIIQILNTSIDVEDF